LLTVVLGLTTAVLWGAPGVPLAVAVRKVGPTAILAGSLVLGTLLVAPVGLFVDLPDVTGRGVLLAGVDGLLMAVAYAITFRAFERCPVSIVTPIVSCEGAAAAVIAIVFGERPSLALGLLLLLAVVGVVLVGAAGRTGVPVSRPGVGLAVGASLIWGMVLYLGGPVTDELGAYWGFFFARSAASLVMLPFFLRPQIRAGIRSEPWRVLAWAAGDTLGNLCYFAAAASGPVALAGVLAAQFATVGSITAVILLGERLKPHQWAGVAIVIAAVTGIAAVTA
jgi:drug/metabolite transporter (DMT)-like permease